MNLYETFTILKPDLTAEPIDVTPDLYKKLDEDYNRFKGHKLVSCYEFDSDWGSWERHPAGDEVVVLLSGSATLVLEKEEGEEAVSLTKPGAYVLVPKNVWHTARVTEPATMLFITPGEGTEHREA